MLMMMLMTVGVFLFAWTVVWSMFELKFMTISPSEVTQRLKHVLKRPLFASFVKILSERSTTVWNEANDPAERVIPLFSFLNCSLTEYLPSCLAKKVETDGRRGSKWIISRELILKNQTQSHMLENYVHCPSLTHKINETKRLILLKHNFGGHFYKHKRVQKHVLPHLFPKFLNQNYPKCPKMPQKCPQIPQNTLWKTAAGA